jgi:hypothetical protein
VDLEGAKGDDHMSVDDDFVCTTAKVAVEDLVFHAGVELAVQAIGCWMLEWV